MLIISRQKPTRRGARGPRSSPMANANFVTKAMATTFRRIPERKGAGVCPAASYRCLWTFLVLLLKYPRKQLQCCSMLMLEDLRRGFRRSVKGLDPESWGHCQSPSQLLSLNQLLDGAPARVHPPAPSHHRLKLPSFRLSGAYGLR